MFDVEQNARRKARVVPLPYCEAEEQVRSYFELSETAGLLVDIPGGIYRGYGIIDEVLHDAFQLDGLLSLSSHLDELGATHVDTFRICDRPLTDFPPGPDESALLKGPTLSLVCRWLSGLNRGPPVRDLNFSETWLNDADLETLVLVLGIGHPSIVLPESIILMRNCITQRGAIEFVEVLAKRLQQTPPHESKRCILDIRYNWIVDVDEFEPFVSRYSKPENGLVVKVCRDPRDIPLSRVSSQTPPYADAELFIVAGPSWTMPEGDLYLNNSYKRDKVPWDLYMAGPASKLACVLEYEGRWTRWDCPLGCRKKDINEEGGRAHCPSVTFGGILASHLRGLPHSKKVWEIAKTPSVIEEFNVGGRSYFFNWLSGSQGYHIEDAESQEVNEHLARQTRSLPPVCMQPPMISREMAPRQTVPSSAASVASSLVYAPPPPSCPPPSGQLPPWQPPVIPLGMVSRHAVPSSAASVASSSFRPPPPPSCPPPSAQPPPPPPNK